MENNEENQQSEILEKEQDSGQEQETVIKRLIPASELKTIRPARYANIKCCSGKS